MKTKPVFRPIIFVMLFCFLCLALPAFGEQVSSTNQYEYIVDADSNATIKHVFTKQFHLYADNYSNPEIASTISGHPVTTLSHNCFDKDEYIRNITIPSSITKIEGNPFLSLEGLESITLPADHTVLATIDGVLFDKTTKTLLAYPRGKRGDSYTVPDGILSIGEDAFARSKLKEVIIPDSVVTIEDGAFFQAI